MIARLVSAWFLLLLIVLSACANQSGPTIAGNDPSAVATREGDISDATPPLATVLPSASATAPAQEPDSSQIIYTRVDAAQQRAAIRRMDHTGGNDREVAACAACTIIDVTSASDGTQLAYVVVSTKGPVALHLVHLDGTGGQVLLEHDSTIELIGFSPDGTRLAYVLNRASESMGIDGSIWVRMISDGRSYQAVDRIYPLGLAAWLDNTHLIYSESDGMGQLGSIYRVPIDGKTHSEPLMAGVLRAISPDRTKLLIGTEPIGHNIAADQLFAHSIVALEGDMPKVLTTLQWTAGSAKWSPDGTMLLHVGTQAIELLHISDGSRTSLEALDKETLFLSPLVWDASGRSILYAKNVPGSPETTAIQRHELDGTEQVVTRFPGAVGVILAATP